MTASEFASLLHAKRVGKGKWIAKCPSHPDQHPSLSIAEGKRQPVVFRCMSHGCSQTDILAAMGLAWRDLLGEPSPQSTARISLRRREESLEWRWQMLLAMALTSGDPWFGALAAVRLLPAQLFADNEFCAHIDRAGDERWKWAMRQWKRMGRNPRYWLAAAVSEHKRWLAIDEDMHPEHRKERLLEEEIGRRGLDAMMEEFAEANGYPVLLTERQAVRQPYQEVDQIDHADHHEDRPDDSRKRGRERQQREEPPDESGDQREHQKRDQ